MRKVLWGILGLALTTPAAAAPNGMEVPTGSHINRPAPADSPDDTGLSPVNQARRVVYDFGRCVVLTYPARVDKLITMSRDQKLEKELHALATSECLREGDLKLSSGLMFGAIFRALYLRDFAAGPVETGIAPLDLTSLTAPTASTADLTYVGMIGFADCVVRADPAHSRDFVVALPGSGAEKEAVRQLRDKLGSCMLAGQQASFSIASLSALMAEALYREARASVGAAMPLRP